MKRYRGAVISNSGRTVFQVYVNAYNPQDATYKVIQAYQSRTGGRYTIRDIREKFQVTIEEVNYWFD